MKPRVSQSAVEHTSLSRLSPLHLVCNSFPKLLDTLYNNRCMRDLDKIRGYNEVVGERVMQQKTFKKLSRGSTPLQAATI